ncbi:hypothetical protein AB685_00425 [Bacillus sp. LL01]|uniref:helix-turn-helix transcriptional regulator n=1 Tax=Bacillus sp. LL01 TaxID=1665556 RepID=UPI00064CE83F|nr:helix-turn-helix transcriptional regulator [Bacillus sp. LL01]KMJ59392.1 hypothetical protein AB685_00425 [Bacillus sp. LL01]
MKPELFAVIRKLNGLSQQAMADRLDVSRSLIAKIELGERGVSADLYGKITQQFQLSLELRRQVERLVETFKTTG